MRRVSGWTYPYQLRAHLGHGLVLRQGDVGEVRRVAGDARVRVAEDVGLPFPARRVGMARPDVLGLQPLELLLRAELVRLDRTVALAFRQARHLIEGAYHNSAAASGGDQQDVVYSSSGHKLTVGPFGLQKCLPLMAD